MKKKIKTSIIVSMLIAMVGATAGCGASNEMTSIEETEIVEGSEDNKVSDPEKADNEITDKTDPDDKGSADEDHPKENGDTESTEETPGDTDESADADDNWGKEFDSPEEILDRYEVSNNTGFILYDVNADGYEELFITHDDHISEIYGNRNGKLRLTISAPETCELTVYPKGMLKMVSSDEEGPHITWFQYYQEFDYFLAVFEEFHGEYYTFCACSLDDVEKEEIRRSLKDTGYYPVWVGEWSDMITKKDYDRMIPNTQPVVLPKADSLSDRSALEVKPENLLYVKTSDGYANLRTGPGTEYDIICRIPDGDEMEEYYKDAISSKVKTKA